MTDTKVDLSEGEKRKGKGPYAVVAILLLVAGILVSFSFNNYTTYRLKQTGNALTLWRGEFAPQGEKKVESFAPVVVEDTEAKSLTARQYDSKDAAYEAILGYFMERIDAESAKGDQANLSRIHQLYDQAQAIFDRATKDGSDLGTSLYRLAQKEVAVAEMSLKRAYRKALPVYERALRQGADDVDMLQAKIEAMRAALGRAAPKRTEAANKIETTPPKPTQVE